MNATYFQATRVSRNPIPTRNEIQDIYVCVMTEDLDALLDDEVEGARFTEDEAAIGWLIARGCSAHEAARIVNTARSQLLTAQTTGTGPTEMERIWGTPMED